MNELELLRERLYETAVPMPGIEMSSEQAFERLNASLKHCTATHYIVRDWLWVDVTSIPDVQHQQFRAAGLKPVVLVTRNVFFRSNRLFIFDDWVRSSLLVNFTEGCFFDTADSLYLLVGDGLRTSADLQTLLKLVPVEDFND